MKRSDFSMKGTHGFLGLFKYKKRREERTSKYQELDGSGSGLRFILNASGSETMEMLQICSRVECVWASY